MTKLFEITGMIVIYTIGILGTGTLLILAWGIWIECAWKECKDKFKCNIHDFILYLEEKEENNK